MLLLLVRVLYSLQVKLSYAPFFLLYNADALNNYIVISQLSIDTVRLYLALTISAVLRFFKVRKFISLI